MVEDERSGLLRTGTVLIAIGTGLRVILLVVLVVSLFFIAPRAGPFELSLIMLVASVGVVGLLLGYLGWKKVQEGQMRGGAMMAMIAAFVPPIDWFFLIGALLVFQSEEGKAERSISKRADVASGRRVH